MKQVIKKYTQILTSLDELTDIDDITKVNIKRCVAIYFNGEILRAFNRYVQQPGTVITADMIAFFYLHLQMSGAANEALNKTFTDSCPGLSSVLFDQTADGKGVARLPRFAGAHSTSLAGLLQGFTPRLFNDYMTAIDEILRVIKASILSLAPSLENMLPKKMKIDFSPMQAVDFSSPKFMVGAQQASTGCLLESIKAIDILAPILSEEQQKSFCESVFGQALAIMARQVVANNIFILVKSKTLTHNADFAELRQFRNCSAHAFVMWEIQNNSMQLLFNCRHLVLDARDTLVTHLQAESQNVLDNYLNPPNLEIKERGEVSSLPAPKEEPARVNKKKKKPANSVEPHASTVTSSKFLALQELQSRGTRNLIGFMLGLKEVPGQPRDTMAKLSEFYGALDDIYNINDGSPIHDINEPVIARAKGRISKITDMSEISWGISTERKSERVGHSICTMEIILGREASCKFRYAVNEVIYPRGIKEAKFYLLGMLFSIFTEKARLLSIPENLELFTKALQKAIDFGASPNTMVQTDSGLEDILSFAIRNNFPKEVIVILLECGANIHNMIGNRAHVNALTHAARSRPDIMLHLLQAGANPLEIIYDPCTVQPCRSSLFYDLIATIDDPIELRLESLRILYPYSFQKYGEEALLTSMQAPVKLYMGGRKIKEAQLLELCVTVMALPTRAQLRSSPSMQTQFTREDMMPALVLHQKVLTVLTDPGFSFYKLVLHDEVGIIRQEIARLGSSQTVLAAMGVNNGNSFTALDFAAELGLTKVHKYLKQEHDRCLGIKPILPASENKAAPSLPLVQVVRAVSHNTAISAATSLSSSQQQISLVGSASCNRAILVGVVAIVCTAMICIVSKYTDIGLSR